MIYIQITNGAIRQKAQVYILNPVPSWVTNTFDDTDTNAQSAFNDPAHYTYTNGTWTYTPPSNQEQLNQTKSQRIAYLNSTYAQTLTKGFTSSALGTVYTYGLADSDEKEWKALNVAITRNAYPTTGYPLKCYDSTGTVQYLTHTQAQAEQVLLDGSTFGMNQLSNLRTKTNNVNAVQLANYATLQDAENAVNAVTY